MFWLPIDILIVDSLVKLLDFCWTVDVPYRQFCSAHHTGLPSRRETCIHSTRIVQSDCRQDTILCRPGRSLECFIVFVYLFIWLFVCLFCIILAFDYFFVVIVRVCLFVCFALLRLLLLFAYSVFFFWSISFAISLNLQFL